MTATASETDGLLGNSSGRRRTTHWQTCCALTSTLLLLLLASALFCIDIHLRWVDGGKNNRDSSAVVVNSPATTTPPSRKKKKYHATQFISFTINTLGGLDEYGECDKNNRSVDPKSGTCYLGDDDIESDINHRLAILEEVLFVLRNDVFKEEPEIDRDPGVLKIFMMPEFFLRGPNGAYSTAQLFDSDNDNEDGLLIKYADRVRELISDAAFDNYLFVLGTVIVAESLNEGKNTSIQGANDLMYFNFAPVYRGGSNMFGQKQHMVLKEYISNADFLSRNKQLPNPADFDLHAYAKADQSKILSETFAKRNITVVTDNFIEVDGIKVGIEICLDHRMGALWNSLRMHHDSILVDVQLITSAGMSIERGPNPLKQSGVVYLSDGEGSSAACLRFDDDSTFDPNHVCRGNPGGLQHRPQGGPGYSSFVSLSGCIDMEKFHLLEGYYSMHQPQGCANTLKTYGIDVMDDYKYYPPSLEVYPTIELPVED